MREVVDWLRKVEELAHDLYARSSTFFDDDRTLSTFLNRLAKDEAWHFQLMAMGSEYLAKSEKPLPSSITIEQTIIDRVEGPLKHANDLLLAQTLSRQQMLDTLVKAEWSEWNPIFLYAVNAL